MRLLSLRRCVSVSLFFFGSILELIGISFPSLGSSIRSPEGFGMPVYKIRGIDVDFPYDAYDCQLVYMEKVIQSLQEGCNALLESPTGTGKTLCLLCATLAWRKTLGGFSLKVDGERNHFSSSQQSDSQSLEVPKSAYPVIIYSSRTHSQLKQVIRELKTCNYRPRMGILGSREQMCIHDDVKKLHGRVQNIACHSLCKRRKCRYQLNVSEFMKSNKAFGDEPFDIEDLVKIGGARDTCPYYVSRELHKVVDILFAPYNYLIDPGNRNSLSGISWDNAVLLFDEAHNLDSICADAASFDLPSNYLAACIAEAKECIDIAIKKRSLERATDKQHDPETYSILRGLLLKLEKHISEIPIESKEVGFTRPGHFIFEFLADLNITYETSSMLIDTIENAALVLEEGATSQVDQQIHSNQACKLSSIRNILKIIFRDGGRSHATFYRFHVQESHSTLADSLKGKPSRTLSWWCFNPGITMEVFVRLGVRSIVLTSGTLSPLETCAQEMNLEFPVRLENPHVVSADQVWVGVVTSGPSGQKLNSSYRYRDSLDYKQELGSTIVNFARIVPDGLLVFFSSYYLMEQCIECWKNMSHARSSNCNTIWERICKHKQPVIEPKQSALFPNVVEDFKKKLQNKAASGAVFFAVCRGKVSEGLDFADHAGRAVLITGMPFIVRTDPKVRLKREYLDDQALSWKKESKEVLTGENWYVQQAARAVNQAIGRVIRHRHDFGAIILCDERFAQPNYQCQMSYWLRPYIKCYPKFGDIVLNLTRFFREKETYTPQKTYLMKSINTAIIKTEVNQTEASNGLSCLNSSTTDIACDPKVSVIAASRVHVHDQLVQILPANRSNLVTQDEMLGTSNANLVCFLKSQRIHLNRIKQDPKVVDLTTSIPDDGKMKPSNVLAPCLVALPKGPKRLREASGCVFDASSEACFKQSSSSDSLDARILNGDKGEDGQASHTKVSKVHETTAVLTSKLPQKEDKTHLLPQKEEASRGSVFLAQVQEKLSSEEYKEFVGFMRALKSKTMKVTAVLESIARLFSSPARLALLEGFEEFVPKTYQAFYQQLHKMLAASSHS